MSDQGHEPGFSPCEMGTCRVWLHMDQQCTGKCGRTPCETCDGTGNALFSMYSRCEACNGTGHARAAA